jgi:hypothetical protein
MAVDLMDEIATLRSQIEALSKQMPSADPATPDRAADPFGALFGGESDALEKIKEQFDGFVELLEKQLHEIPAGTAIAIFALGVLMGRLLPR